MSFLNCSIFLHFSLFSECIMEPLQFGLWIFSGGNIKKKEKHKRKSQRIKRAKAEKGGLLIVLHCLLRGECSSGCNSPQRRVKHCSTEWLATRWPLCLFVAVFALSISYQIFTPGTFDSTRLSGPGGYLYIVTPLLSSQCHLLLPPPTRRSQRYGAFPLPALWYWLRGRPVLVSWGTPSR